MAAKGTAAVISRRELNRALLARQALLERSDATVVATVEQVAGLQAQLARPPFIGLLTRLRHFRRDQLTDALHDRSVVRVTAMRGTLHLLSARDYLAWRAPLQAALDCGLASIVGDALKTMDMAGAEKSVRALLARTPATFEAIRDHLGPKYPDVNVRHLAYALRLTLPLVQVPVDDNPWAFPGSAAFSTADSWLKARVSTKAATATAMMRRYLAAFGPASVTDAQAWSGIPKLAPVFEAMRDELITFRDERKRELFDLPDALRPAADTAAPVRFLPEFDTAILGHHDRTRIISDEHRRRVSTKNLQVLATILVDGEVAGTWTIERKKRRAVLTAQPFAPLPARVRKALVQEGEALLAFTEGDESVECEVAIK
ncbi:MAG: AlkZ family DNA glycosylase [Acidobacteria bacterium]|nr:AlkZ family DNA glycosylase [Acidobacteriota bacterium]